MCADYLSKCRPNLLWWHTNNNAGFGSARAGKIAKRMGVRPGVPDLFIPLSNAQHNGLFIELKSTQGRLSKVQKQVMEQLDKNGYAVKVCRSLDEVIRTIKEYVDDYGRSQNTHKPTKSSCSNLI